MAKYSAPDPNVSVQEQLEYIRDQLKEERDEQRRREQAEIKRQAKKAKFKHVPGESLLTFIWKELRRELFS
jgi:regulator of protease activity HflC (stomatin/prohibitin superfamily)